MNICPVCCKQLKLIVSHRKQYIAYAGDDNAAWRYVGRDCYKNILKAGETGYTQKEGYIRWFASEELAWKFINKP